MTRLQFDEEKIYDSETLYTIFYVEPYMVPNLNYLSAKSVEQSKTLKNLTIVNGMGTNRMWFKDLN